MLDHRNAAAPGGRTRGEAVNDHQGAGSLHSLPGTPDLHTVAALTGYAVLVTVPTDPEPRVRRRLFLSLHSAQRAAERAESRGLDAQLVLVRMVPEGVGTW